MECRKCKTELPEEARFCMKCGVEQEVRRTAKRRGNIAPSIIQEVMRHTKFATTQRYIHPDTAATHAAVNTLGKGKDASPEGC